MSESGQIRISPEVASCIGKGATRERKIAAARGEVHFAPRDLGVVLLYLCHDADEEVKQEARRQVLRLSEEVLLEMLGQEEVHPKLLDMIARCHYPKTVIAQRLAGHPAIAQVTVLFLAEKVPSVIGSNAEHSENAPEHDASGDQMALDEEEEYEPETEEHHNKYQLAQIMGVADKIKMALTGDKEWRSMLIKDSNKQVSGAVVKNPRITDAEVLNIAKSSIQNDEVLRVICHNKEWVKNYQIRKALVENHRTPLPTALRFMSTLGEKDLAILAKSKNVATVIATQARRLILQKKRD